MNLGLSGWTQREQRIDKRSGIRESECKKKTRMGAHGTKLQCNKLTKPVFIN